jgi:hypothetical protein
MENGFINTWSNFNRLARQREAGGARLPDLAQLVRNRRALGCGRRHRQ